MLVGEVLAWVQGLWQQQQQQQQQQQPDYHAKDGGPIMLRMYGLEVAVRGFARARCWSSPALSTMSSPTVRPSSQLLEGLGFRV